MSVIALSAWRVAASKQDSFNYENSTEIVRSTCKQFFLAANERPKVEFSLKAETFAIACLLTFLLSSRVSKIMEADSTRYHTDELTPPAWLSADFMAKVMRHYERAAPDSLIINKLEFSPATVKGDHYASIMFRAVVQYTIDSKERCKSLIVKTMPEADSSKNELLGNTHIFETEVSIYQRVLPQFQMLLRAIGDATQFGANCVYYEEAPRQLLIFEDLCALGYQVVRRRFCTLAEVTVAYTKLAKWHALSHQINAEQPTFFSQFRYHFLTFPNMMTHNFMTEGLTFFIELLDTRPTLRPYVTYFESIQSSCMERMFNSFEEYYTNRDTNACYVLNHGDFHSKNLMFKSSNDSANVEDCLLLDYQTCFVGSPALDLMYSMYMLMDARVRREHLDQVLEHYFSEFTTTLKTMGYKEPLPTLKNFRQSFLKHKEFELFLLHTFLPMSYGFMEGGDAAEIFAISSLRRALYYRQEYIDELEYALPRFAKLGYFDSS